MRLVLNLISFIMHLFLRIFSKLPGRNTEKGRKAHMHIYVLF